MSRFKKLRPGDPVWVFTEEGDKQADVVIGIDGWMNRIFVRDFNYTFNLQTGNSLRGDSLDLVEESDKGTWREALDSKETP